MTYRVAVAGFSFGGLNAVKRLLKLAENFSEKIEITIIEPRAGFINVMAIPLTIMDTQSAETTFVELYDTGIVWDSVKLHGNKDESKYKNVMRSLNSNKPHDGLIGEKIAANSNVSTHFIQGYVTQLDDFSLKYTQKKLGKRDVPREFEAVTESDDVKTLHFDYCILATGRGRNWPYDPVGTTKAEFESEMKTFQERLKSANKITIVGGGALGIEVAGELKKHFASKQINLVHPYNNLPPEETVTAEFKAKVQELLENVGVDLKLGCRLKSSGSGTELKLIKDGNAMDFKTDLVCWCNYHKNNIGYIADSDIKVINKDEISVNDFMEVEKKSGGFHERIYAVGDITSIPILKTAGSAYRQGEVAATNIFRLISGSNRGKEVLPWKDFKGGMVLVIGLGNTVYVTTEGAVIHNDAAINEYYKDYRNENIWQTSGLNAQYFQKKQQQQVQSDAGSKSATKTAVSAGNKTVSA